MCVYIFLCVWGVCVNPHSFFLEFDGLISNIVFLFFFFFFFFLYKNFFLVVPRDRLFRCLVFFLLLSIFLLTFFFCGANLLLILFSFLSSSLSLSLPLCQLPHIFAPSQKKSNSCMRIYKYINLSSIN